MTMLTGKQVRRCSAETVQEKLQLTVHWTGAETDC